MSDTGKQSPLGVNVLNALLTTQGLQINSKMVSWVGTSHNFTDYIFGKVCQDTVLRLCTWSIHIAYLRKEAGQISSVTYNNIISIGAGSTNIPITSIVSGQDTSTGQYYIEVSYNINQAVTVGQFIRINEASPIAFNGNWLISEIVDTNTFRIYTTVGYGVATSNGYFIVDSQVPALGNSKPFSYVWEEPNAPYGTGTFNLIGDIGWGGSTYKSNNPVTQWGYIRLLALQAWMEFNYNSTLEQGSTYNPRGYRDFLQSFQNAYSFISYSNNAILSVDNSIDFLDGTFSNMNDLITADVTNVNLALKSWGQDLILLGKALDLSNIDIFGLPSVLLKTLAKYSAITKNLSLAIIAAGIPVDELGSILGNITQPTIIQERKLYASFVLTVGDALQEILISLNCKTEGLESLADLLDPKKLFPNSYASLTVPIYTDNNTTPTQTTTVADNGTTVVSNLSNSKISYLIYTNNGVNPQLTSPEILNKIGVQVIPGSPLISEDNNTDATIVIQEPVRGFGSYLSTIVPPAIATTAGAFSASMQQIKNIKEIPIEKFGQVVINLETMAIATVNGTPVSLNTNQGTQNNVPTNLSLRSAALPLIALGSGPQGSYTASDFFGCMSGLPYNGSSEYPSRNTPEWGLEGIFNKLKQVATRKLYNIYHELYLAVTWSKATTYITQNIYNVNVQSYIAPNPSAIPPIAGQPRIDDWYYTVEFGIDDNGGGYGRGSAPAPTVQLTPNNCGGSLTIKIGTDDNEVPGNFGKVLENTKNYGTAYKYATTSVMQSAAPSAPLAPEEFLYIQAPPIQPFPVQDDGSFYPTGYNHDPGYKAGSQGGTVAGYNGWPYMESVVQGYINQANLEITYISKSQPDACRKLNSYWNSTGNQLTIEQRARMTGYKPPLSDPREDYLSLWPTTIYTFTDSMPTYGKNTDSQMYAQTLENISDWNNVGGQSIVAMMRQDRNQDRLSLIGIDLDNNINDQIARPTSQLSSLGSELSSPAINYNNNSITPEPLGSYDSGTAIVPGTFGENPYQNIIPPTLNAWTSSSSLIPSTYTVNSAIEEVIRCNCDCWNLA
jgi:hypothetical protein